MSDVVIVSIIVAISGIVTASISAYALIQSKATHELINSRMTELLRVAAEAAHAAGVAQGEQSQRDRQAAPE